MWALPTEELVWHLGSKKTKQIRASLKPESFNFSTKKMERKVFRDALTFLTKNKKISVFT